MPYDEVAALAENLSYRDKFRLAQLLIQLARKEEEESHPTDRQNLLKRRLWSQSSSST